MYSIARAAAVAARIAAPAEDSHELYGAKIYIIN